MDLAEACWGTSHVGVRRIRDLVSQLGPDSAIAREMGWSWDDLREMTATLIELEVNGRRKKKTDPLYSHPRPPGVKAAKAPTTGPAEPLSRSGVRAALVW